VAIRETSYHIKGFTQKYGKNRHTLTHYKGTGVLVSASTRPDPESPINEVFLNITLEGNRRLSTQRRCLGPGGPFPYRSSSQ